jgi:hypothetical protein
LNGSFRFSDFPALRAIPPAVGIAQVVAPKTVDFSVGPNKYLAKLNSAAMLSLQIRKGDGAILTDLIYLNATSARNSVASITAPAGKVAFPVTLASGARISGGIFELALSPTIARGGLSSVSAVLGFRFDALTASANWTLSAGSTGQFARSGGISQFSNTFAPIAGITGRIGIGRNFFIPYYGDYGAGGNLETYQFIAGIAYAYHAGAVSLVWRQLQYQQSSDPTALFQVLRLGGPALAWTFRL